MSTEGNKHHHARHSSSITTHACTLACIITHLESVCRIIELVDVCMWDGHPQVEPLLRLSLARGDTPHDLPREPLLLLVLHILLDDTQQMIKAAARLRLEEQSFEDVVVRLSKHDMRTSTRTCSKHVRQTKGRGHVPTRATSDGTGHVPLQCCSWSRRLGHDMPKPTSSCERCNCA